LWDHDSDGTPIGVTCPAGHRADLIPSRVEGRFLARFDAERCAKCQHFRVPCRVEERKRVAPTLYVERTSIESAQRRQRLCPQDSSIRTLVESTVRSLKRGFPGSKLPVRGLIRARMVLYPAALMVNLRRLHCHMEKRAEEATEESATYLSLLKGVLLHGWRSVFRPFSMLSTAQNARPVAA
jgi:hypothetical protein